MLARARAKMEAAAAAIDAKAKELDARYDLKAKMEAASAKATELTDKANAHINDATASIKIGLAISHVGTDPWAVPLAGTFDARPVLHQHKGGLSDALCAEAAVALPSTVRLTISAAGIAVATACPGMDGAWTGPELQPMDTIECWELAGGDDSGGGVLGWRQLGSARGGCTVLSCARVPCHSPPLRYYVDSGGVHDGGGSVVFA
eukprot:SAG25_NODE_1912_length_2151_cov_1.919551_2_plen_205_part_00